MQKYLKIQYIIAIILLIIGILSFTVIGNYASSAENHSESIKTLDEKKKVVMNLTASSTLLSVALTALPGDTATPIAEKLADLSGYFLFIMTSIYLEKFLLTVLGFAAFKVILPIACIIGIFATFFPNQIRLRYISIKLGLFALTIASVIPLSLTISNKIEETQKINIEQSIESANKTANKIKKSSANDTSSKKNTKNSSDNMLDKAKNFISNAKDKAADLGNSLSVSYEKTKTVLNSFIDIIALFIVTTCIIPILTLATLIWLTNLFFNLKINHNSLVPSNLIKKS
ncbi:hypothetical protein [Lachnobacterium bovis]|uniref:Beta-carotene 15,15'-monooxygenase n=1 Tax=Lachnobacterium bovis TaxID=140626 RepID=A0A1H9S9R5_9FIRM|nr:hypothetical protein [Lachnobacterium bovis]SER81740.1 hypothetical protein SAMN02910429_01156 [Lachnobacterium bovis]